MWWCCELQVEKRVGDSVFNIPDLCSLIRVLSLGARGDVQVTTNVWIHLGSRYKEIDAMNIARVYCVMRYITPDLNYLWKVVEKQLKVKYNDYLILKLFLSLLCNLD